MNIITAKNPHKFMGVEAIELDVLFEGFNEFIPFSASPSDSTEHGRELYSRAVYCEFGPVEERERPTLPVSEADLLRQRDALMAEATAKIDPLLDAKELGLATEQELAELAAEQRYRIELMRLPQSPSWPDAVEWPERPA